ncbi:progonadoliberin-1-like [Hoplias malabaricus]|uniref:progonadoliberin-1-like n=1 Tax=Hoplias malabaricus TaxID=27720 RepID=UPI0034621A6A
MNMRTALLWMTVCAGLLQVHGQRWSYGLSPGGQRAAEGLVGTFQQTDENTPKKGPYSYVCDHVDVSPRNQPSRLKELLVNLESREN